MNTTFDQVADFYSNCKAYWARQAFWWDCVEVWNFDHSWNDAKRDFAEMFGYKEGDPVPSADLVERGCA